MKATRHIRKITRVISLFPGFLLITAFALDAGAAGQTVSAENDSLRIKYFSLEDGLSQVSINDLLQDRKGWIWIATQDGLNRFDGKEFKHFKYNEKDSLTISGNLINKIYEDNSGKIWVGTIGNGLNYYNQELDFFHRIKLQGSSNENEIISGIAETKNGSIWVTSRVSGLHQLIPLTDGGFSQKNYFSDHLLNALYVDQDEMLWAGDLNGNIFSFNPNDNQIPKENPEFTVEGQVLSIFNTGEYLLVGTDYGFFINDLLEKKTEFIEFKSEGVATKYISTFYPYGVSTIWVGTGSGLFLFDWIEKKVVRKIKYAETGDDTGLSNNTVQALLELPDQKLLVGTANDLELLDFKEPYFKNISKNKKGDHLINDNVVFSIFEDGDDLWIGTSDGGLNLIRAGRTYSFKEDINNPTSISDNVVREIIKDKKNQRLWLATTKGLNMIDLKTFNPNNAKFTVFHYDPEDDNTINGDFLKGLTLDKNNNLWGVTYGHGIFRLEMSQYNKVNITRYKHESINKNSLPNDFAQCIRVDNQNNIWVGTQAGLTKLSFKNDTYDQPVFTNYSRDTDSADRTLSHNSVYDILIDNITNQIWVGTRHGLNLFLGNNEFKSWTEQKQFPNAVVYSILNGENGKIWLGTNDGIVRFDPEDENFTHYGVQDGIQSKEFNIHAKFRNSRGDMYLGGIAGLSFFQPKKLNKMDHPVPIYFSQLQIKDEIITTRNATYPLLKSALHNTSELEIKDREFPFNIRFSTTDYRLDKNYEFAYKLLPNDTEWNMLNEREIQFVNLPAGDYTLQVNGFSRGEEWAQDPLEMNLHILPPWWRSWWAYLIYLCLIGALAWWFYRFQISRKLAVAESERLREINQLKNNLYTNITHEFRTPLTVILGMTDALKSKIQNKDLAKTDESLGMIQRNGKKLLRLVNEMLDLTKLESGNMELQLIRSDIIPFVKYIGESFQSLAEESQINLTVYSEIDELIMDFDADKLSTVLTNLLSNAIKFTSRHGKIIMHVNRILETNDEFFMVKVKDNGAGIPEEALPHIFDRFYQADSSASRRGEGTGIGLALTKELVERMGGTIGVKSVLEEGSEFTVRLPVTRDAPEKAWVAPSGEPQQLVPVSTDAQDNGEPLPGDSDDLPVTLLIEDNKDVAEYLKTCLNGKYQTLHAGDGIEGIDMAYEHIPDIIICDVMMPGKDGFEVCSTLKTDERTDHIPMIMLTAKATKKDRLAGLSHGADAYLTKPFSKSELFTRMDQLVLLRQKMLQKFESVGFAQLLKSRSQSPETKFIQKIVKIIHEEISSDSLNSKQLAYKLHLSESQLYRKLKAISGKSTAVFIRSVRLQKAKELILATDKSISEIAYDTGFNDPSWFSRAYKEEFGFAPSETYK